MKQKRCSGCQKDKPVIAFSRNKSAKDGMQGRCKACQAASNKSWLARNRAKRNAYRVQWQRVNKGRYAEQTRIRSLQRKYGMSSTAYSQMLIEQGGVCRLCGGVNDSGRRLSVDHDHATGKIRGLLCNRCNFLVGYIETNKERLYDALVYVGI